MWHRVCNIKSNNGALGENMAKTRLLATRRLVAKDVPVDDEPKWRAQAKKIGVTYRFRGRGSRIDAAEAALKDGSWRNFLGDDHPIAAHKDESLSMFHKAHIRQYLYNTFRQDLPLKYSNRMSIYTR
jgi:hypothetical protein